MQSGTYALCRETYPTVIITRENVTIERPSADEVFKPQKIYIRTDEGLVSLDRMAELARRSEILVALLHQSELLGAEQTIRKMYDALILDQASQ